MAEVIEFGRAVLVFAAGVTLALYSSKLTERVPIPAPAIFLFAAAVASDLIPALGRVMPIHVVVDAVSLALVLILFDGGMSVGRRRFRAAWAPILGLGVAGTFLTTGLLALAGHYLLDLSWLTAGIVATALAPTDPAVMFSVFGRKQVVGRSGTVLEGESGANDPVGIALMLSLLQAAPSSHGGGAGAVALNFVIEMGVGAAVGLAAAVLLSRTMRYITLPSEGLYPLRTLAAAFVIYGAATLLHGSGFLAVFVAGIAIGDVHAPYKVAIERFHSSLASLAEIIAFAALGLTISLTSLGTERIWLTGLLLALLLAVIVRPLVAGALLVPVRMSRGEKVFIAWGGLKGAVPILLGAFALQAGVDGAQTIYNIVFVVVAFSVIAQGTTMFAVARRLGVPMRDVEPEPWDIAVRLQGEPRGLRRFFVGDDSRAAGVAIKDLPIGEQAWISMIIRHGHIARPHGDYVLQPGDEVLVLAEAERAAVLHHLFEGRPAGS